MEADGFLYNMVRAIAGTLINVGRGFWPEAQVAEILNAEDRTAGGPDGPAAGAVPDAGDATSEPRERPDGDIIGPLTRLRSPPRCERDDRLDLPRPPRNPPLAGRRCRRPYGAGVKSITNRALVLAALRTFRLESS